MERAEWQQALPLTTADTSPALAPCHSTPVSHSSKAIFDAVDATIRRIIMKSRMPSVPEFEPANVVGYDKRDCAHPTCAQCGGQPLSVLVSISYITSLGTNGCFVSVICSATWACRQITHLIWKNGHTLSFCLVICHKRVRQAARRSGRR